MHGTRPPFPELSPEEQALIALAQIPGIGPGRIRLLLSQLGSAEAVLTASAKQLQRIPGVGPQLAQNIAAFNARPVIQDQRLRAVRTKAQLLSLWNPNFPYLLQQIDDPPAFLWLRGRLTEVDQQAIAIVGTRRASEYGKRLATYFAGELARQGFTIVSGLAYGIDAAAHRGALHAGGRTLAVLGSGVDRIYPSSHRKLARAIVEQGALLSEYPLGAPPDAPNFPRRNRIIAGLSLGTLVIEAYETGGALITARLALDYNREVFALPGPADAPSSAGCHRLIQQGVARLVTSPEDILSELPLSSLRVSSKGPPEEPLQKLSAIEQKLLNVLDTSPLHIEVICARTELDPATALVYLLELEFKGFVRQMAGRQFFRT